MSRDRSSTKQLAKQAPPSPEGKRPRKDYFNLLSSMTKSKLGELFLCVADSEVAIERQRQILASLPDFQPYAAFTRLDRDRKEGISAKDIAYFIR